MLTINSVKNGIVIDHIKAGHGIKIFNYLGLDECRLFCSTNNECRE